MQKKVSSISFIGLSKVTIGAPQNIRIEMFSQAPSDSDENHHEIPASTSVGVGNGHGQYAWNIYFTSVYLQHNSGQHNRAKRFTLQK